MALPLVLQAFRPDYHLDAEQRDSWFQTAKFHTGAARRPRRARQAPMDRLCPHYATFSLSTCDALAIVHAPLRIRVSWLELWCPPVGICSGMQRTQEAVRAFPRMQNRSDSEQVLSYERKSAVSAHDDKICACQR